MNIDAKKLSILGIAIISFFSTLWVRPADLMESRNFISAREIVCNNDWLVTTLNGAYRFEKPPLPTWLTALTMEISHNFADEWILRIPVAMACVLLVLYMYKFVDALLQDKHSAFLSSFVLCTTFMVTKVGAENAWDAYPYIFMFIALFYCVRLLQSNKLCFVFPASFFFACSLLSKGPVALYGMFIPCCIAYIIVYKFEKVARNKGRLCLFLVLGIALASFWPIAMMVENADLFISVLMKEQSTWAHKHIQPFYYYLHFFGFMGIWAFFTVLLFLKPWKVKNEQEKLFQFGRLWSVLTLLFLSIVHMKKERYGLPIYIELAIPLGILLQEYMKSAWTTLKNIEKKVFLLQCFCIILICSGAIVLIIWKVDTLYGKILLSLPFFAMLWYMITRYRGNRDVFKNAVIYCSGILLLCINANVTWIIEHDFRGAEHTEIPALEELQHECLCKPIYSTHFSIQEVWSVGRTIEKLDITKLLPVEFYILGDVDALPDGYEIVEQKMYRMEQDKDTTVIFSTVRQALQQNAFCKRYTRGKGPWNMFF